MNTPDTEKKHQKHCRASLGFVCSCLPDVIDFTVKTEEFTPTTPDTEWEKIAVKLWNIALDEDNKNARQEFRDVLTQARTSRDTYWKERVRDVKFDIEALRGSPRDTDIEYARAITDVHKILDDIIDNLK